MDYNQISITLKPYSSENSEILMAWMGNIGFESFMENEAGFDAYIPTSAFNEASLLILQKDASNIVFEYAINLIPHQNWNAVWESNYFKPIVIGNECVVRSPFHEQFPHIRHQIVIEPKMAFGTGHHETTAMVMERILELNMAGKKVLDMGCGTGILGILASMCGASEVVGIDIDHWCIENSEENCQLNKIFNMKVLLGDASTLSTLSTFDIILANINRNILLEDLPDYSKLLQNKGVIVLSGFYNSDLNAIDEIAQKEKLFKISVKENNNWVAVSYEKSIEV